jgi:hypothetical protein
MRVLIFDDDDYKAQAVKTWIANTRLKCECDVVKTKAEFLNIIDIKYDYFLIDFYLDGSNTGDEIARLYIKKHPECDILIYSAYRNAMEGINDFKKMQFDQLQDFMKEFIKGNPPSSIITDAPSNNPYQIYEIREMRKDVEQQTKRIEVLFDALEKNEPRVNFISENVARHDVLLNTSKETSNRIENKLDKIHTRLDDCDDKFDHKFSWLAGIILASIGIGFILTNFYIHHLIAR